MGTGERRKTSAAVYFCFLLVRHSLVRRRIHFSKKAAYFVKWKAAPCWRLSTRMGNRAFKKSGVFCDCSNLPVLPDTQPLTHPLPVRGTSQGGKAAVFTSSLQSASFATSHPLGGVFCKVESSPLLEIIYPYGEQNLKINTRF